MNKIILALLLSIPFFSHGIPSVNLITHEPKNFHVSMNEEFLIIAPWDNEEFLITAPGEGEFRKSQKDSGYWKLVAYEPFKLIYEGVRKEKNCIQGQIHKSQKDSEGIMAPRTQFWIFQATQPGSYDIEFAKPFPSPMQGMLTEKIIVNVEKRSISVSL